MNMVGSTKLTFMIDTEDSKSSFCYQEKILKGKKRKGKIKHHRQKGLLFFTSIWLTFFSLLRFISILHHPRRNISTACEGGSVFGETRGGGFIGMVMQRRRKRSSAPPISPLPDVFDHLIHHGHPGPVLRLLRYAEQRHLQESKHLVLSAFSPRQLYVEHLWRPFLSHHGLHPLGQILFTVHHRGPARQYLQQNDPEAVHIASLPGFCHRSVGTGAEGRGGWWWRD